MDKPVHSRNFEQTQSHFTGVGDALSGKDQYSKPAPQQTVPLHDSQRSVSDNPNICLSKVENQVVFPAEVSTWWSCTKSKVNYAHTNTVSLNRLLGEYQQRLNSFVRYQQKKSHGVPVPWLNKLPSSVDAAEYINRMAQDISQAQLHKAHNLLCAVQSVSSEADQDIALPAQNYPKVSGLSDQFTKVDKADLEPFITQTLTPTLIADMARQMADQNVTAEQFDAAGGCIVESNNHCWLCVPAGLKANEGFSGYRLTFPKGHIESEDTESLTQETLISRLLATAIRETFEESGFLIKPTEFVGAVKGSSTQTAYFLGQRIAGDPFYAEFETETVTLKPLTGLAELLRVENKNPCLGEVLIPKLEKTLEAHYQNQSGVVSRY